MLESETLFVPQIPVIQTKMNTKLYQLLSEAEGSSRPDYLLLDVL